MGWSPVVRISFRFAFIYLSVYLLTAVPLFGGGIGNNPQFALAAAVIAAAVTPLWSIVDGKRDHYEALHLWLRWAVRYFVLAMMVIYGLAKIIQFPAPSASQLQQPLGSLSRMGLLWAFMGTSKAYTLFAGACEVSAGLLLAGRRTTTLGALMCTAVMSNVWLLNVAYSVPVKVLSFHLLLMSIFLVLSDIRRLTGFFLLNQPQPAVDIKPLFKDPRLNRLGAALRAVLLLTVLIAAVFVYGVTLYRSRG